MFSGVSGLRSHQTMMDVIGNNIANVNTVGYKGSTAVFQDLLTQVLNGAGVPTAAVGGTNPAQVGLGVRVAGVSTSFNQGAAQLTGRATDLSIQGDGFFVVRQQNQTLYTRAGALDFDAMGRLVTPDGAILQGWSALAGAIDTNDAIGDITMPLGQAIEPQDTSDIRIGGNLDASAAPGTVVTSPIDIFDEQGTAYKVTFSFTKTATANEWTLSAAADMDGDGTDEALTVGNNTLTFDPSTGALTSGAPTLTTGLPTFTDPLTITTGAPGAPDALTGFSGTGSVSVLGQNGYGLGLLQSFTIGNDGIITGNFSNGRNRPIGQVALANFANPVGLEKVGGSLYRDTVNSGVAQVGTAGTNGRGTLSGGTLEMSNVDLAREFTNLIVAQRGFQANSRVITASDEILQDLVNLKR
jgi:flagellar hook protein FlgE